MNSLNTSSSILSGNAQSLLNKTVYIHRVRNINGIFTYFNQKGTISIYKSNDDKKYSKLNDYNLTWLNLGSKASFLLDEDDVIYYNTKETHPELFL